MQKNNPAPIPDWASWIQNWCGTWKSETNTTSQIEIGMLVVKLPDGSMHPGVVTPTSGRLQAGGFGFRATDNNGKKCLEVVSALRSGRSKDDEVPTEGEMYEEDDET